ncbi:uncharacterized protein LOC120088789 [Benincasa hispida]|uniref:uncharacterized protein LOC120088789 n=1 Tax=Benincasa hispida TaxID=102211 RepID=UPI001902984A|nr:uncharacterized protein LOC120088789 [Benincasa hispida]
MKNFLSIFSVSISLFFLFSLSIAAYSWIFYLSTTIHKDYMFLFCNSLLVFICLNSRLSVSLEKDRRQELAEKRQAAGCCESRLLDRRRTVGDVGETLSVVVEETYGDDYYGDLAAGDDETLLVKVEVTPTDELDAVEDDRTLSVVIEETKGDELETVVEDNKTLSVIEETQDEDFEVVEDAKTLRIIEEFRDHELGIVEGDKTLSIFEETRNDEEQEQGGSVDSISLEELNRKCEEFIRRMKKDIRIEILTI